MQIYKKFFSFEVRKISSCGLYICMAKKDEIELLFRNNYKGMLTLAVRLLHNEEAARDIVHDVFAAILAGKAEYATPAYLLTGVRLACLKYIRSLSTRERLNKLYAVDLHEMKQ